jgi:CBS domain-containing protein
MQSTTEHTGPSAVYGSGQGSVEGRGEGKVIARLQSWGNRRDGGSRVSPFVGERPEGDPIRVGDLPIRPVPVIPAHLSMAAARKVAELKQIALLLVEREDHIVGTIDERAFATGNGVTAVASAMTPLATCVRPATPVTEARALFVRARADILPVVVGGFVLGAVTLGDVERARPRS